MVFFPLSLHSASQEHFRSKGERDAYRAAGTSSGVHRTLHSVSGSRNQAIRSLQFHMHSYDPQRKISQIVWSSVNLVLLTIELSLEARILGVVIFIFPRSKMDPFTCLGLVTTHVRLLWPHVCSLPGSSGHGIFQARILESVAISLSMGYSQPGEQTRVSFIAGGLFTDWTTREAPA